jgi:3-hydroxyacyl-CoA dehydrogenase
MDLNTRLENVSVIGAGGKMGSGIVLIVCREMLRLKLLPENQGKTYALKCIDLNESALEGLKTYLQKQLAKTAEKKIEKIKASYPDISEDEKVIEQYAADGLSFVSFESTLTGAANSNMVFEAIFENREIKIQALTEIKNSCGPDTYFFTNTSSIPIRVLEEGAGLEGRIIGYHFYNPTAIQKLLELIPTANTVAELKDDIANDLAKRLGKKVIPSCVISCMLREKWTDSARRCLFPRLFMSWIQSVRTF